MVEMPPLNTRIYKYSSYGKMNHTLKFKRANPQLDCKHPVVWLRKHQFVHKVKVNGQNVRTHT